MLQVEARTGYGGGYNERGVVEYRRREPSSDDEYDEFGRKKRKRKGDTQDKVIFNILYFLFQFKTKQNINIPRFFMYILCTMAEWNLKLRRVELMYLLYEVFLEAHNY